MSHPRPGLVDLARRYPLALVALGVLLYSSGPVFVAASDTSGAVFSLWRLWFGVLVFGVGTFVSVRTGGARWPRMRGAGARRAWGYAASAGAAFGTHQLFFFTAVKATSVTDVMLMNTLAPIIVAVAAIPLFGERPGLRFRLWTLVAIAGAAVVILDASTGPEGDPVGMGLAFAGIALFSVFFLLSKQAREAIDVMPFLLGVMLVAALTVTLYVLVANEPVMEVGARDLWFALVVAAGPGGVGHFVMTWPLRWVAANIPPLMRLAQPAFGGYLAWAFLGQPVTAAHLLGGAVTVTGVAGALVFPGRRPARDRPPAPDVDDDPDTIASGGR